MLAGDVKDVLLLDVTPLTLGIETKGGVMTKLIERNTTIPTRKSEIFSTAEDNQPSVEVHVLQGEREMAAYNKSLGKFQLTGIPPAPRGMPQIEVTFDIDANGILNVSAKDLGTGKEQKIEIKAGSGLSDEEIERMVKDAESHADEDRRARELAEARNNGENAAYQAEKQLGELGDAVDESSKSEIEEAIKAVRDVLESEDADEIRSKTDALQQAFHKVSEQMYAAAAQQQAEASANGAPEDGAGDDARMTRRSSTPRSWTGTSSGRDESSSRGRAGEPDATVEDPRSRSVRRGEEAAPRRSPSPRPSASATSTSSSRSARRRSSRTSASARPARPRRRASARRRTSSASCCRCSTTSSVRSRSAGEGEQHLADGVRMVHAQLVAALEREGIQAVRPGGRAVRPGVPRGALDAQEDGASPGASSTSSRRATG